MRRRLIVAALLTLGAAATAADAAPRDAASAPARRDWANMVVLLPDGAYRLGNPAAKVRLIEYLSMTCPHCAHFETDALPVLRRDYVAKGLVSIEFKHAIRDGFDFAASLLARCGGPARYLGDVDAIFRSQATWIARAEGFVMPEGVAESALPAVFARRAGLDALVAARGLPPRRAAACLADPAEQARLTAMRTEAFDTRGIGGTPGFVLNDAVTGAYRWEELKPLIDAALR